MKDGHRFGHSHLLPEMFLGLIPPLNGRQATRCITWGGFYSAELFLFFLSFYNNINNNNNNNNNDDNDLFNFEGTTEEQRAFAGPLLLAGMEALATFSSQDLPKCPFRYAHEPMAVVQNIIYARPQTA